MRGHQIINYCPNCGDRFSNISEPSCCANCGFVHYDNPKPLTAAVVPYNRGLVLVKRRFEPFTGSWCLPGGFIEARESPYDAVCREVAEETGLSVLNAELWGAELVPRKSLNQIVIFYLASRVEGILKAGDDALDVAVFNADEMPSNIPFMLHRLMIEKWKVWSREQAIH